MEAKDGRSVVYSNGRTVCYMYADGDVAHGAYTKKGRGGHFLWISFLAIDVTSHLEREVGRGGRRNRRALDTARALG